MLCVFWNQRDIIWYELLEPGETVDGVRYQRQLADLNQIRQKCPEYQLRHDQLIFLDDKAPAHRTTTHQ